MRLTPLLALLLACVAAGLTACGDDDGDGGGEGQPEAFEVEANEQGVSAPESVPPGAIEVRFSNTGEEDHSIQIVAVGDGHTADEALEAGEGWGENGEPLPEWMRFLGGVGSTPPGGAGTAVVDLDPGEYVAFDIESDAETPYAEFTVEGGDGAALPEADARIEAVEYAFNADGLEAGGRQVLFENTGEEPHHLIAAPIARGRTIEDVRRFVENEEGRPPIDEERAIDTAILSGGTSTVVDLRLARREYALLCFVPDRAGGPPHAFKGMVSAATVE